MKGSSSAQAPFLASIFFLRLLLIVLLTASTWPLACGCRGDENVLLIPSWAQISLTLALSNYAPLTVTIDAGMPWRHIMDFQMKFVVLATVILARGSASTHLVK